MNIGRPGKPHPRPVVLDEGVLLKYKGPPRLHCWVGPVTGMGYPLGSAVKVDPADVEGMVAFGMWEEKPKPKAPKPEPKEADKK